MISFKKAIFALGLGLGLSAGVSAWAAPDCVTCEYMRLDCEAGSASACTTYNRLCHYPPGSCSIE